MMGSVEQLSIRVLISGLDDWVAINEIILSGVFLGMDESEAWPAMRKIVTQLCGLGLAELGQVVGEDGFTARDDLGVMLENLDRDYFSGGDSWTYMYWLNLTSSGERLAQILMDLDLDPYREDE